jgi:hypothetical protein
MLLSGLPWATPFPEVEQLAKLCARYAHLEEAYRTAELLFPALPSWAKHDPLLLPGLQSVAAFADPGRPPAAGSR